jgi:hypothetical protein
MGGIVGRLSREFSLPRTSAIAVSSVASFTITMMMAFCATPVIYLLIDRLRRRPEPAAIGRQRNRPELALSRLKRAAAGRIAGRCQNNPKLKPAP